MGRIEIVGDPVNREQHLLKRNIMSGKSIAAAALVLGAFAGMSAFAEEVTLTACTQDGKTASLKVAVTGTMNAVGDNAAAPLSLKTVAETAFTKAANSLESEKLLSVEGYIAFMSNMLDATAGRERSQDLSFSLAGKPTIVPDVPACKI